MILTLVVFFAVLGILVLVHELGHFYVARKFGVKVDEFGLGLPPRIFGLYKDNFGKWKKVGLKSENTSKTIWSLNWIPLGGFVKIKGEDGGNREDEDSFIKKSVGKRMAIISAGVSMNLILAAAIFSVLLVIGSPQVIDNQQLMPFAKVKGTQVRVMDVLPESPAANIGIEVGDSIISIDGQIIGSISQVQNYLSQKADINVDLKIERKKEIIKKEAIPGLIGETGRAGLGVALIETGIVSYPWYLAPFYGIWETARMVFGIIAGFYLIIKNLIIDQNLIGEVYGPVGIASLVGDAARLGLIYLLQLTAVLSVIIAVINFLPFPALDGGRIFFLLIEAIRRKPVNQKIENAVHNIGFALLMLLILVVTFNDIARVSSGLFGWWDKISGLF